ncbi:MAG: gamma-glutamylcyclotransferase [Synechococcales cyanobacterium RM1_1_8]|nr:gamma-glutamylcyclotransferase [Synechococcales cyanobacterium RM1_1_8]
MSELKRFFICGSALRGQPDHQNLKGASFVGEAKTQPRYRLHAIKSGWHPGIYEADEGQGISIPGEIYEMTAEQYDYLIANEPPDMYEAPIALDNGDRVSAMLYPKALCLDWPDISGLGGWAAYKVAGE